MAYKLGASETPMISFENQRNAMKQGTSVVQLKEKLKDHLNDQINFPAFKSNSFKRIII